MLRRWNERLEFEAAAQHKACLALEVLDRIHASPEKVRLERVNGDGLEGVFFLILRSNISPHFNLCLNFGHRSWATLLILVNEQKKIKMFKAVFLGYEPDRQTQDRVLIYPRRRF